jgi:3-phenylpropionate/trans-cinnamate dioxygenase ferredoxin reductase subunit
MARVIIAGGGQAGIQVAAGLRQEGFEGDIVVVADEPSMPYQRPPLSKHYLSGKVGMERVTLRPDKFYEDNSIDIRTGIGVIGIKPDDNSVTLSDGEELGYDWLVLATGSRVRRLDSVDGADLAGIHYLRTLVDVDSIRAEFETANDVVVVGGGYIGLEVASVASELGKRVTVLEAAERILQRVATPGLSDFYTAAHTSHGVRIVTGANAAAFVGADRVSAVQLADGSEVPADLVIIGIGIIPNVEIADAAGIACDNGITVDEYCKTSHPNILAVGDCTNHPNAFAGGRVRLESVPNAMEQGRVAAATICGNPKAYQSEPWFWSDQFDLKLQMVGFATDADEIVTRGSVEDGSFINFYLKEGTVIAAEAVNSVRDFMSCRKMVAGRVEVPSAQLVDPELNLKDLVG